MSGQKSKQNVSESSMDAVVCTTASSNTIRPRRRMNQNYLLIWIDGSIDEANNDCQSTLAQLRSVVNEVTICTEPAQCIKCLNDTDDEKAFIISSGDLGQHLVSQIHDMPQLDTMYILCDDESQHEAWTKEWPKIEGVFTSIKPIWESLKKVARQCDHDKILMSFVPKRTMPATASDQQNLDQLESTYMYSLLFKEIILGIDEDNAKSVKDLVAYCRQQEISESELKDFQDQYHQKSPVWWYTCDIFLYSMLNRALRSLDMEAMAKMGFFVRNLHRQLEQLHQEQSDSYKKQFIVYRGQGLSQQDFNHLLDTKGGLLLFNNFLSTSTEKHVAVRCIECALHKDKDTVGVLFIMTINPSKVSAFSTPFALINDYSSFSQEKEVLFSMHPVFCVGEIKQAVNNNRLWEVQLTLTDNNDPQLSTITRRIRGETRGSTGWDRMGQLMLKMGHLNQAEELYNDLLKNSSSDSDRGHIYHMLGYLKNDQEQCKEAASFYEKSLEIYRKTLPEDHPSLANTYNKIGRAYNNTGDCSKALEFYENALKIREKALPPNHPDLAQSYSNIGGVYYGMGDYLKAFQYYEKAHKIKETALPPNHSDLATSYNNIGATYDAMGDHSKALEFYKNALKIREKALPPNHPDLAQSYNNIGGVYSCMDDHSKALEFHEKALKIKVKALLPNQPDLATSYNNIGVAYYHKGNNSKALSFLEKSLTILQESLPPTHPLIKQAIDNINYAKKKI
ncbi:unnamed protein product [Rotaria sp. Silwood1]|nr:unnamed protein product [Rotaria sp. Silwood1]